MNQINKLIVKLKSKPKDFTWDELCKLLLNLGFIELKAGQTGGSWVKFYLESVNLITNLHKPHPKPIIKSYIIEQVITKLKEENLI